MVTMTSSPPENLLRNHRAFVKSDNPFQRTVRLRQALWREKRGYPIGLHRGVPLGTRLLMPGAEEHLWNYLTDGIRDVVRAEVLDPRWSEGKLFARPRIFDDLLSSQPLCFNLFGELKRDLGLASRVLGRLAPSRVKTVHRIEFEHSPGRGDPTHHRRLPYLLGPCSTMIKEPLGWCIPCDPSLCWGGLDRAHTPLLGRNADEG